MQLAASQCAGIAQQIEDLEAERDGLQQELHTAPPSMKPFLLREIRLINAELGRLRQQLRLCQQQNPPAPRPDLAARTVILHVNHTTKKVGVAALTRNIGLGNAHGPFRIDLAATLIRGGVTTSFVQVFEVPAGVTLSGVPVASQDVQAQQQAAIVMFPGTIPSQEYVTQDMVLPLFYRDESPSAVYEFEFVVDSEQQVSESNEGNNHFFVRWWTTRPNATLRATPFEIEVKTGKVDKGAE